MTRAIRQDEFELVSYLLQLIKDRPEISIPKLVSDLDDGGMGSIRFDLGDKRQFGNELIQVNYVDDEGIDVIISLYLDDQNDLFELEFWKVNFNELKRYPKPKDYNKLKINYP
jgi:hypothetical protein